MLATYLETYSVVPVGYSLNGKCWITLLKHITRTRERPRSIQAKIRSGEGKNHLSGLKRYSGKKASWPEAIQP